MFDVLLAPAWHLMVLEVLRDTVNQQILEKEEALHWIALMGDAINTSTAKRQTNVSCWLFL